MFACAGYTAARRACMGLGPRAEGGAVQPVSVQNGPHLHLPGDCAAQLDEDFRRQEQAQVCRFLTCGWRVPSALPPTRTGSRETPRSMAPPFPLPLKQVQDPHELCSVGEFAPESWHPSQGLLNVAGAAIALPAPPLFSCFTRSSFLLGGGATARTHPFIFRLNENPLRGSAHGCPCLFWTTFHATNARKCAPLKDTNCMIFSRESRATNKTRRT